MPKVSVIVPTRNRHHLLPRALRSLYNQTFQDFEVIIVDDNAPESRIKKDPALAPLLDHPKVRIVENAKPKNAAAARNCGLHIVSGEWITYLDDDDAYVPDKLAKQLTTAQETGLPLGLCGLTYNLAGGRRRLKQTSKHYFDGQELFLDTHPDTKAIFHRKAPIFFNEDLSAGEDAYFFHSLVTHFGVMRVFNVAEPLIEVYAHSGPRVNRNAEALWQGNFAVYRDFGPKYGRLAANLFYARTRLQSFKYRTGGFQEMVKLSLALIRLQGSKDIRLIANVWGSKVPILRRWLV